MYIIYALAIIKGDVGVIYFDSQSRNISYFCEQLTASVKTAITISSF